MPQEPLSGSLDSRYWCLSLNVLVERKLVKLHWQLSHLYAELCFCSLVIAVDGQDSCFATLLSEFWIAFHG